MSLGQRRTDLSTNRKGDIAELYVQIIAQWKGAEVFHNIGCDGKTDMVLKIDDQLVQIDVKVAHPSKKEATTWSCAEASRVELPVYPLIVVPEGDIMDWKIRWKRNDTRHGPQHCPPGLEDFWSKPSTNV